MVGNINGLIRRFCPKGTNFDTIKHKEIKQAAKWINNRPMKVSGYKTPNEVFQELKKLASQVLRFVHELSMLQILRNVKIILQTAVFQL